MTTPQIDIPILCEKLQFPCFCGHANVCSNSTIKETVCDTLLSEQGIASAPVMPNRPDAKLEDIPVGARFTDPEIAAKLAADNAVGLVACSQAMGQSIREDIGALFAKYHLTKAAIGLKILHLTKKKGWLIPPPLLVKRPESVKA
jgi:hypothetical protein